MIFEQVKKNVSSKYTKVSQQKPQLGTLSQQLGSHWHQNTCIHVCIANALLNNTQVFTWTRPLKKNNKTTMGSSVILQKTTIIGGTKKCTRSNKSCLQQWHSDNNGQQCYFTEDYNSQGSTEKCTWPHSDNNGQQCYFTKAYNSLGCTEKWTQCNQSCLLISHILTTMGSSVILQKTTTIGGTKKCTRCNWRHLLISHILTTMGSSIILQKTITIGCTEKCT